MKRISVIIPTYNDHEYLGDALRSLAGQSLTDFEVLVVDDGSADGEAVVRMCRQYFPYLDLTLFAIPHSGPTPARNTGWSCARGSRLFFMDVDVRLHGECLERLDLQLSRVREMDRRCVYAFCSFEWVDERGTVVRQHEVKTYDAPRLREVSYIPTMSLMITEVFPGFDPEIKRLMDWDVYLTLDDRGYRGTAVPMCLFQTIDRGGGISDTGKDDFVRWRKYIQAKHRR